MLKTYFTVREAKSSKAISNHNQVAEFVMSQYSKLDENVKEKEVFSVIHLNNRNKVKAFEVVSIGTLTSSLVHPRETFRQAIMNNAQSIIIAHNHPSGETNPSEEDIKITKRLYDAGQILGIELLDHIIVGDNSHASLMDMGII